MALRAIYVFVFSFEWKNGVVVVKSRKPPLTGKGFFYVAFLAVGAELTPMGIVVAAATVVKSDFGEMLELFAIAHFFLVALYAVHLYMLSL